MKVVGIIPARYGSTRFPGKPLALINDKPMIWHTYERALKAKRIDELIVATDDDHIFEVVKNFGAEAVLTFTIFKSGTDRVAAVARDIEADIIVNIQADEPFIDPSSIDKAIEAAAEDPLVLVSTLKCRIKKEEELTDPNVVKVVTNKKGEALYFSRAPIPYCFRENRLYYKHIGLYVFRRDFLFAFTDLPPSALEETEGLEQLRILENGYPIKVVETEYEGIGVDTKEDLEKVEAIFLTKQEIS
ncbi:3-deoxy-manno-octulosonate cytidylyltransferase [bacterium]|nr:3-deoxy-manno-octulosonate cytidylyltransferase [bacterium]